MSPFPTTNDDVASLRGHPGFQTILDWIDKYLRDEVDAIASEADPRDALRRLRRWQAMKQFVVILRLAPEQIQQELQNTAFATPDPEADYWLGR